MRTPSFSAACASLSPRGSFAVRSPFRPVVQQGLFGLLTLLQLCSGTGNEGPPAPAELFVWNVTSPAQLSAALEGGAAHILITEHLDLRNMPVANPSDGEDEALTFAEKLAENVVTMRVRVPRSNAPLQRSERGLLRVPESQGVLGDGRRACRPASPCSRGCRAIGEKASVLWRRDGSERRCMERMQAVAL